MFVDSFYGERPGNQLLVRHRLREWNTIHKNHLRPARDGAKLLGQREGIAQTPRSASQVVEYTFALS